jgi:hypothetical protein
MEELSRLSLDKLDPEVLGVLSAWDEKDKFLGMLCSNQMISVAFSLKSKGTIVHHLSVMKRKLGAPNFTSTRVHTTTLVVKIEQRILKWEVGTVHHAGDVMKISNINVYSQRTLPDTEDLSSE